MTIGINLGDVWSHYCRLTKKERSLVEAATELLLKGVEKSFTDQPPARVAMQAGTHSIWIS